MLAKLLKDFFVEESGQGITEYGAILAFVALIIAIVFGMQGTFKQALSNAFSSVGNQLNSISAVS
jgi:Flp pilus assembly pilin Flp